MKEDEEVAAEVGSEPLDDKLEKLVVLIVEDARTLFQRLRGWRAKYSDRSPHAIATRAQTEALKASIEVFPYFDDATLEEKKAIAARYQYLSVIALNEEIANLHLDFVRGDEEAAKEPEGELVA